MPELPDLGGEWGAQGLPGRRLSFGGDIVGGPGEVWAHPFRLMHDLVIRGRTTAYGAALDLPLAIWDIEADDTAPAATWSVDLRRRSVSAEGTRLLCLGSDSPSRALFGVEAGVLSIVGDRISAWRTPGRSQGAPRALRLLAVGAVDEDDLRRTLDLLGRRRVPGLARQRAQHAEQVARGGATLRTPDDESVAAAFEAAKSAADAMIAESPGWGRAPLDRSGGAPGVYVTGTACWTALGLLAAGMRDAARDTLRFLSRRQTPSGDIPIDCTLDGAARYRAGEGAADFLQLATWYRSWTGDAALLDELAPVLERARRCSSRGTAGSAAPRSGPAATLLEGVARWGVEPDAPRQAVRLRPVLPARWTRMSLARLRVGRSVLDLHLRRRAETAQLTIRRGSGPATSVDCEVAGFEAGLAQLDGVPMGSARVRFEASGDHELLLHAAG